MRPEGYQFCCLLRRLAGSAGGLSLYWGITLGCLYLPCSYDGVKRLEYEASGLLYLLVGGEAAKAEADGGVATVGGEADGAQDVRGFGGAGGAGGGARYQGDGIDEGRKGVRPGFWTFERKCC